MVVNREDVKYWAWKAARYIYRKLPPGFREKSRKGELTAVAFEAGTVLEVLLHAGYWISYLQAGTTPYYSPNVILPHAALMGGVGVAALLTNHIELRSKDAIAEKLKKETSKNGKSRNYYAVILENSVVLSKEGVSKALDNSEVFLENVAIYLAGSRNKEKIRSAEENIKKWFILPPEKKKNDTKKNLWKLIKKYDKGPELYRKIIQMYAPEISRLMEGKGDVVLVTDTKSPYVLFDRNSIYSCAAYDSYRTYTGINYLKHKNLSMLSLRKIPAKALKEFSSPEEILKLSGNVHGTVYLMVGRDETGKKVLIVDSVEAGKKLRNYLKSRNGVRTLLKVLKDYAREKGVEYTLIASFGREHKVNYVARRFSDTSGDILKKKKEITFYLEKDPEIPEKEKIYVDFLQRDATFDELYSGIKIEGCYLSTL